MRGAAGAILVASLLAFGAVALASASAHEIIARKVPRPPECPDCGIGAKLVNAE